MHLHVQRLSLAFRTNCRPDSMRISFAAHLIGFARQGPVRVQCKQSELATAAEANANEVISSACCIQMRRIRRQFPLLIYAAKSGNEAQWQQSIGYRQIGQRKFVNSKNNNKLNDSQGADKSCRCRRCCCWRYCCCCCWLMTLIDDVCMRWAGT